MAGYDSVAIETQRTFTLRDLVAVIFRHKWLMTTCMPGIFLGATLIGILLPTYRADTKILLNRERADPAVSAEGKAAVTSRDLVTEEELNSEVELVHSDDVLRKVVLECGLQHRRSMFSWLFPRRTEDQKIARAVRALGGSLDIEPVKKTNLIEVQYTSHNAQLAAQVLRSLDKAYMDKHLQVERPPGEYEFFAKETERYKAALDKAENDLRQFPLKAGASPQMARDITLQRLNDFKATLAQTQGQVAETQDRIHTLQQEMAGTPSRLTTSVKKDIQQLVVLKTNLLTLELKRTELLTKFQPTYPLITEVDKQIADTRASIELAEKGPLVEETTDRDPTYEWISSELAKAKADLAGFEALATATERVVNEYQAKAEQLEQLGVTQQDLLRTAKAAEDNYLLYQQKREEARIADALDKTRILNVAVAQEAVVPVLPMYSAFFFAVIGAVIGLVASVAIAFILDYFDQSFRTPVEVETVLNIPVLAAVPSSRNGVNGHPGTNGFGRRKGGNGIAVVTGAPIDGNTTDDESAVI